MFIARSHSHTDCMHAHARSHALTHTHTQNGAAAAAGGIQAGDRVMSINGHMLENVTSKLLTSLVMGPPGSEARVIIRRPDGSQADVTIFRGDGPAGGTLREEASRESLSSEVHTYA